jgi:hypothetical protein
MSVEKQFWLMMLALIIAIFLFMAWAMRGSG